MGLLSRIAAPSVSRAYSGVPSMGMIPPLGSVSSSSGAQISQATAMTVSAVYACVNRLATDLARCTPYLYRRDSKGIEERDDDHPLYELFERPNPQQEWFEFAYQLWVGYLLRGNCYAPIQRNGRGEPTALIPVNPDAAMVLEASDGSVFVNLNRIGLWQIAMLRDFPVAIPSEDVFHLRGLTFNSLVGVSTIGLARDAIGLSMALEQQAARWVANGARPAMVLETGKTLGAEAAKRLKTQFDDLHAGYQNTGKTVVLEEGLTARELQLTSVDLEFIAQRQWQPEECCFVPGVEVLTAAGPKPIETIEVGERVLTHRGRWRPVTNVMRRDYVGKVVTVQAKGLEPVTSTDAHPFYAIELKKNRHGALDLKAAADWIAAQDLRKSGINASGDRSRRPFHALTMPILAPDQPITKFDLVHWAPPSAVVNDVSVRWSTNGRATPCHRFPEMGYDFGWLCGAYVGDGSVGDHQVSFDIGAHKTETNEKLSERLSEVFGVSSSVRQVLNVTRTVVSNRVLHALFSDFGRSAREKHLPDWCLTAAPEFRRGVVDGLLATDGCVHGAVTMIRTTSPALAWQIRLLLWASGFNASLTKQPAGEWRIKGRSGLSLPIMTVQWRVDRQRPGTMVDAGQVVGFALTRHDVDDYDGPVFNLEVEEDESYTTVGGEVHNCRFYGVPPHKIGLYADKRSDPQPQTAQDQDYVNSAVTWRATSFEKRLAWTFGLDKDAKGRRLPRDEQLRIKHDLSELLRADIATQANVSRLNVLSGITTQNEERAGRGLPPLPGGDRLMMPTNMAAEGSQTSGQAPDGAGRPKAGTVGLGGAGTGGTQATTQGTADPAEATP